MITGGAERATGNQIAQKNDENVGVPQCLFQKDES